GLGPVPGLEAKLVRRGERLPVEIGEQERGRLVLAHEIRAVDVAVADPVLERNAPLPARRASGRAGQGLPVSGQCAGDRHGAVARQPLAPVDETDAQRLPDEKRAEARAVDEQVAFDTPAVLEPDRGDETAFGVLLDLDDA